MTKSQYTVQVSTVLYKTSMEKWLYSGIREGYIFYGEFFPGLYSFVLCTETL